MDYTQFKLSLRDHDRISAETYEDYIKNINHSVLETAKYLCMKEIYSRAQPKVDYDELLKAFFNNPQKEEDRFPDHYYINLSELKYIVDKYVSAYNFGDPWNSYLELLIDNAENGYSIDKYIPAYTDENGLYHPGYRDYDHKPKLQEQINEIIDDEEKSKEISKLFVDFINNRKDYYRHDLLRSSFNFDIYLGHSPNTNLEQVKTYWKEQGQDIEIDPRNHDNDYFYSEEHGYLEEDE